MVSVKQFGRAIVCSDASAEAARYGFTAVDRPEGFLVLAIASLGDNVPEVKKVPQVCELFLNPFQMMGRHLTQFPFCCNSMGQDTKSLEEKKIGVKGLGRKKPNESEHFVWKDNIKVPCGHLVPSDYTESPLEYNEYAVYDPKLV